jgi:GntR family transcriptional regulator/MocR family aminotransferase
VARIRTSSAIELLLPLRRDDPLPLHRQLEEELRTAARTGRLPPGSVLPSTRALAAELGIARGVVVEAYDQLVAEGYLVSRPGSSTRVARVPTPPAESSPSAAAVPFEIDFRPGRPDLDTFPRAAWLRSLRRVLNQAPGDRLGYLDGRGMPELRSALATYLNRVRGTCATADGMIVSTGFAQGLRLAARVLRASGARRIGVEDPSDPEYRGMAADEGLEVAGIPVDEAGLRVDLLDGAGVDAVLVTPAHQFPTGGVLPANRRAALIAWANRHDGTVIEDDYDAEFRFDRKPVGALQGLCADRVIYAGTASKTLAPGLRLGWLAAPRRFVEPLARAKKAADQGSAALDQLAFADFLERGELDRHLRRARAIYSRRRAALLTAMARHLPLLRPAGASAGLHVLAWLPDAIDEAALVRSAAERGIGLWGLSASRIRPAGPGGIVFGYGSVDERRIAEGITRLATLVADEFRSLDRSPLLMPRSSSTTYPESRQKLS